MSYIQAPSPTQRVVPLTGDTVAITQTKAPLALVLAPAGVLATLTITLPASTYDGQTCAVTTTNTITALTVNAASGSISGDAVATLLANASLRYVWNASATTWYRLS